MTEQQPIHIRALRAAALLAALAVGAASTACGGDESETPAAEPDSASMAALLEAHKSRQALADSVISTAPEMAAVVEKLGASRYAVADSALAAAVRREAEKTRDCYTNARRDHDPNLTAVLDVLVNFGGAGWDLMRVEIWTYSSAAGGAVVTCINSRARAEWKLPTTGIRPGAHLVRIVYRPDSTTSPSAR
jgi:hypothetical protein